MIKKLNNLPRRYRWPLKWLIMGLAYFLVCYPYPHLFLRHVQRWRDPNALIQADALLLRTLANEVRAELDDEDDPRRILETVESYVGGRVPYAFDWETWGVVDYLPTVEEVLEMGREDCDGQAVVGASLLQNLGVRAELVTDFAHVWVKTEHGELFGPRPSKSVEGTDDGLKVNWGWGLVTNFSDAMAYGVAVFPPVRQVIVLLAAWFVLIGPNTGRKTVLIAGLLLFAGLLLMREGGRDPRAPLRWIQFIGFAQLVAGISALVLSGRGEFMSSESRVPSSAPRTKPAPPESTC